MKLVQYIVLRKDLAKKWTKGANIAQACHAVTKCLVAFRNDDLVKQYTSPENINEMTKIILSAEDEKELLELIVVLNEAQIDFIEWLENPENILTCIALKPYQQDDVSGFMKKFCLYK